LLGNFQLSAASNTCETRVKREMGADHSSVKVISIAL